MGARAQTLGRRLRIQSYIVIPMYRYVEARTWIRGRQGTVGGVPVGARLLSAAERAAGAGAQRGPGRHGPARANQCQQQGLDRRDKFPARARRRAGRSVSLSGVLQHGLGAPVVY